MRPRDLIAALRLLRTMYRGPSDDNLSAAEWLHSARPTQAITDMLDPALAGMFCADLEDVSALQVRDFMEGVGGAIPCILGGISMQFRIVEGMSAFHERLAAMLPDPVRLGTTVTHVQQDDTGVTLGCDDGSSVEVDYAVLCTPTTATIKFDPPLPEQSAYDAVTYGQATKVAAVVSRKRPSPGPPARPSLLRLRRTQPTLAHPHGGRGRERPGDRCRGRGASRRNRLARR
nr:FAD-dependent oxidoreductase [Nocardia concava]